MRKLFRTTAAALALAAALVFAPGQADAIGYEDSLDDCGYPLIFDGTVMRPLGFAGMLVGAVGLGLFTATLIGPAMVNRDYPTLAYDMVVPAAKFTFSRPLGQCGAD